MPSLWLDSSVARSPRDVRQLAEGARRAGVQVLVSAQVHLEICRQRRAQHGSGFSPELFNGILDQLHVEVVEVRFDRAKAEAWAALLHERYGTEDAWQGAKLRSLRAALPQGCQLPAHRVPMTTDWLIALAVEEQDDYIAVADKGEEWCGLRALTPRRALSCTEAMAWLEGQAPPIDA